MKTLICLLLFLILPPLMAPNPNLHSTVNLQKTVTGSKYQEWETIRVYRTFYCATSSLCRKKICGGNKRTAWNKDATKAGGCAVDPRNIRYGSVVKVGDKQYVCDDTFGERQRERDWKKGIVHIDIRVAGKPHKEVARMGAGWIWVKVKRNIKTTKSPKPHGLMWIDMMIHDCRQYLSMSRGEIGTIMEEPPHMLDEEASREWGVIQYRFKKLKDECMRAAGKAPLDWENR